MLLFPPITQPSLHYPYRVAFHCFKLTAGVFAAAVNDGGVADWRVGVGDGANRRIGGGRRARVSALVARLRQHRRRVLTDLVQIFCN